MSTTAYSQVAHIHSDHTIRDQLGDALVSLVSPAVVKVCPRLDEMKNCLILYEERSVDDMVICSLSFSRAREAAFVSSIKFSSIITTFPEMQNSIRSSVIETGAVFPSGYVRIYESSVEPCIRLEKHENPNYITVVTEMIVKLAVKIMLLPTQ